METLKIMAENILFIQTAFIGDAILSLPAIQQLHKIFPGCKISVLCIPSTKEIFAASDFVNEVIVFDKKDKHKSLLSTYWFAKELSKKNFTRLYSLHRSFRTSLLTLATGIKETFGFDNSDLKHAYRNLIKYFPDKHEVQRNLDLIGFNYYNTNWKIKPEICPSDDVKNRISEFVEANNLKKGFIAIAPGSVWFTKRYPEKYFEKIISHFTSKNSTVVLIGGKNDSDLCKRLQINEKDLINTSNKFNLIESIELLKFAKLLISNDSAPTHMGMCADIKVLTIYCSTIPKFGFYPYNTKSKYLSFDELDCKPCGIHGHQKCPVKSFDCAEKLYPEKIIQVAEGMLSED